jgi:hypothetical protein
VFNLTLFSQHTKRLDWLSEHGYVHFVWTFDSSKRPLWTWDNEVEYTFTKAGEYTVKVEAINAISRQFGSITIRVHGEHCSCINKAIMVWKMMSGKV